MTAAVFGPSAGDQMPPECPSMIRPSHGEAQAAAAPPFVERRQCALVCAGKRFNVILIGHRNPGGRLAAELGGAFAHDERVGVDDFAPQAMEDRGKGGFESGESPSISAGPSPISNRTFTVRSATSAARRSPRPAQRGDRPAPAFEGGVVPASSADRSLISATRLVRRAQDFSASSSMRR